jgi:hypothetical protein
MGFSDSDLTPLLFPGPGPDVGFRQGTVLTWDAETGTNTIDVGGATLTNVPVLNSTEVISLEAGDVVALLTFKSSFFILGRVLIPGSAQFAPSAVAFEVFAGIGSDFSVTTTDLDKASDTVNVPAWADQAIVMAVGNVSPFNSGAGAGIWECRTRISTFTGQPAVTAYDATGSAMSVPSLTSSAGVLVIDPGATLTVAVKAKTQSGSIPQHTASQANVHGIAVFRNVG